MLLRVCLGVYVCACVKVCAGWVVLAGIDSLPDTRVATSAQTRPLHDGHQRRYDQQFLVLGVLE